MRQILFVPQRNCYIKDVVLFEGGLDPSTPRVFRVLWMVVFGLDRFPVVLGRNPSTKRIYPQILPKGFLGSTLGNSSTLSTPVLVPVHSSTPSNNHQGPSKKVWKNRRTKLFVLVISRAHVPVVRERAKDTLRRERAKDTSTRCPCELPRYGEGR